MGAMEKGSHGSGLVKKKEKKKTNKYALAQKRGQKSSVFPP